MSESEAHYREVVGRCILELDDRVSRLERAMSERITHGRHCVCSACAQQDWSDPRLAPCGMHGIFCPPEYQPLGAPGDREPSSPSRIPQDKESSA